MTKRETRVTDGEFRILEVLWDRGRATVKEITAIVYDDQSFSKYQSVQKLLERLERKGCVRRDRSGTAHSFVPNVDREDVIGQRLKQVADSLCGGSLTPLLMNLASRTRLTASEKTALEKLINRPKK